MKWTDFLNELIPIRKHRIGPEERAVYDRYQTALSATPGTAPSPTDEPLLDLAWKVFKEETDRRGSIATRAAGLLGAIGLIVALLLALAGNVPSRRAALPTTAQIALDVAFIAAILYFICCLILSIKLQRPSLRFTVGPEEILPSSLASMPGSSYEEKTAIQVVSMTVKNYEVNQEDNVRLENAQAALRNALIALIAGVVLLYAFGQRTVPQKPSVACTIEIGPADSIPADLRSRLDALEAECQR